MKIHNERELQKMAINHSADIYYKDFLKIYRNCTNEPYSFLTIDTTLPANNPKRFRKIFFRFSFIKTTLTEQVKILDDKIKTNKAQYDLDREAPKISALSSGELEKYKYLTDEDLGYKSDVIQKAKFEYSPFGKAFNKGLDESDKKGLLKRLKNIEDTSEEQLKMIENEKDNQLGIKSAVSVLDEELLQEARNVLTKLSNQEKIINSSFALREV